MAAARSTRRHSGIRWDRLGRVALLGVLGLVLFLYVGPAKSWIEAYREAGRKRAEVAVLKERNRELRARKVQLQRPGTLEREARRLGMVRAGERPFVVEDLP